MNLQKTARHLLGALLLVLLAWQALLSLGGYSEALFPSPLATERAKRERLAAALDRLGGRNRFCAILACSGRGTGPRRDESEKR